MANNLYRRGKVWWARMQVSGHDIRRSLGTEKRSEALIRLAAWLASGRRSERAAPPATRPSQPRRVIEVSGGS